MDTGGFSEQGVRAGLDAMLADALLHGYTCRGRMSFPPRAGSEMTLFRNVCFVPDRGKCPGNPRVRRLQIDGTPARRGTEALPAVDPHLIRFSDQVQTQQSRSERGFGAWRNHHQFHLGDTRSLEPENQCRAPR